MADLRPALPPLRGEIIGPPFTSRPNSPNLGSKYPPAAAAIPSCSGLGAFCIPAVFPIQAARTDLMAFRTPAPNPIPPPIDCNADRVAPVLSPW